MTPLVSSGAGSVVPLGPMWGSDPSPLVASHAGDTALKLKANTNLCFDDPYLIDRNFCIYYRLHRSPSTAPQVDTDGIREPDFGSLLCGNIISGVIIPTFAAIRLHFHPTWEAASINDVFMIPTLSTATSVFISVFIDAPPIYIDGIRELVFGSLLCGNIIFGAVICTFAAIMLQFYPQLRKLHPLMSSYLMAIDALLTATCLFIVAFIVAPPVDIDVFASLFLVLYFIETLSPVATQWKQFPRNLPLQPFLLTE
uniref:Uncharacterized protein n=1 Tax=Leersia perrieri TaxID=77586 RepID=A0A0D9WWY1_9ORYZ